MTLFGAPQEQRNWWTKGLGKEKGTEELGNSEEFSSGREKRETNPSNDPSHSTDKKTSTTNMTGLKPAQDFFFSFILSSFPPEFLLLFCPSFFFYSFFLPSFTFFIPSSCFFYLFFVLIYVKIPSSYDILNDLKEYNNSMLNKKK